MLAVCKILDNVSLRDPAVGFVEGAESSTAGLVLGLQCLVLPGDSRTASISWGCRAVAKQDNTEVSFHEKLSHARAREGEEAQGVSVVISRLQN